ncbi:mannonate dehydratase [uncultured Cyclobacterium sp.]|uniref:mannonate dehydratase n=1 Tax=uncultured Cyclobacterium sp. TaxID=453820 RepID=UPI0030EF64CF|tara:strand:+ start:102010 stop:103146 length:1137 start_codon:yes stop_codon:yes gene_type:complete
MKIERRNFLQNSAKLTGLALAGPVVLPSISKAGLTIKHPFERDLGMKLCLAYFWGIETHKTALSRQMDVMGAVSPIHAHLAGLPNEKDNSRKVIQAIKNAWAKEGLNLRVVEGPPYLGTKTKLGLSGRDEEIENFIILMKNLALEGIDTICYNWMPVISWARTFLDKQGRGGALVSGFDVKDLVKKDPITEYGDLSPELMWKNLAYFLEAVVPEAERHGIKLALHPDDPPVDSIQGIPRIITSVEAFKKMLALYPSENNGITFCQGSFASMGNADQPVDIPEAIRYFGKKKAIHFVHFRDVRGDKNNFEETFHDEGKTDMFAAMQTYHEIGFKGPIRPDHVPTMAGDSNDKPGYSTIGTLFAIGYIRGLMEGVGKCQV